MDPRDDRRRQFREKFSVPSFESVTDALEVLSPNVVVICCPTDQHFNVLRLLLEVECIEAILCEKPLSYDIDEARRMVEMCDERSIGLFVNYMRRADPNVIELRNKIQSGEIGGPIKICAWYSKGIYNNGSHVIDLAKFYLALIEDMPY